MTENNTTNKIINVMKQSRNDPEKRMMVKQLFEIDPENHISKRNNKLKVNYNEAIFFSPLPDRKNDYSKDGEHNKNKEILKANSKSNENEQELTKIINNVINMNNNNSNMNTEKPSIKVNLNINNNYYSSNYNYVVKVKQSDKEKTPSTSVSDVNCNTFNTNPRMSTSTIKTNHQPRNSTTSFSSETLQTRKSAYKEPNYNFLFIPCINCNNLIHVDEIENHSNICVRVKNEVIIAESSQFSCHTLDFKLKKLKEHINIISNENLISNINNGQELLKDKHYISVLSQYISDSLNISKIENKSISELKKILTNIDTLTATFKGSMATLILIERTRVLVHDKISVFKEDYKRSVQTKKHNERKSGTINTLKIMQLEKEMLEKKKLADKLEAEKEMMLRKVNNLKKTPQNRRNSTSPTRDSFKLKSDYVECQNKGYNEPEKIQADDGDVSDEDESINRLDAKRIYNHKNIIDDINSDLEERSIKSDEYSDCTSMTSSASITSNNNDMKKFGLDDESTTPNDVRNSSSTVSAIPEYKKMYQDFVKLMLKVKFEKIHSSHKGQQISEKLLFKECIRQNIPQRNWMDFIINELKNPSKYSHSSKRDTKLKNVKNYISSNMEIINEKEEIQKDL